jgi:hypothetical protein
MDLNYPLRSTVTQSIFPVDFPLSLSVADLPSAHTETAGLLYDMEDNGDQSPAGQVQGGSDNSVAATLHHQSPMQARSRNSRWATQQPVVVVANVMSPTAYREKITDASRSLGYVVAQRKLPTSQAWLDGREFSDIPGLALQCCYP